MLPCVNENSLKLFSITADERFSLGEGIFIRTHSPITMRRFLGNQEIDPWNEQDLFYSLAQNNSEGNIGNRTYVLYGAAGSGKSETIRWLQHKLYNTPRAPLILRISRTELDPVKILEKLLQQFSGTGLTQSVLIHWDSLQKKTVTLANHLVWSALGKMFDSDEKIIPLTYKLRPIIEENLKTKFFSCGEDTHSVPAELISLEQLEIIVEDTCFDCNINCEQLQSLMIRELEQEMFGGYNFKETLKRIGSNVFRQTGIRPLLLIDDLVQSLNVFASDLLDFFITLDEGNWDIVMGLTPASFESTKRGRELLNRISNLDTFDDRMMKLWFSDEHGSQSYFLNIDNCIDYAARYMQEAKRQNGYDCDYRCIHADYCASLHEEYPGAVTLLPFNEASLKRMYLHIPENKGRPRHFINSIGNVLTLYLQNKHTTAWETYFKREYAPACEDSCLRLLLSVYTSPSAVDDGHVLVNPALAKFFFPALNEAKIPVSVELIPLTSLSTIHDAYDIDDSLDPVKQAIRDWLDGLPVNKELFRSVRQGLASVYRDIVQPNSLSLPYSPRQNSTVRIEKDFEGCRFALNLEDVGEESSEDAILVSRSLGHATFLFENIHSLRGYTKEKQLSRIFSQDESFKLLYQTDALRKQTEQQLDNELGMHPADFAYCCFYVLLETGQAEQELPPCFNFRIIHQYPADLRHTVKLPPEIVFLIYQQFRDWFLLRENIYDGPSIEIVKKRYRALDVFSVLNSIDAKSVDPHYKIGNYLLCNFIDKIQDHISKWFDFWNSTLVKERLETFRQVFRLVEECSNPRLLEEVNIYVNDIASYCSLPAPLLPDWQLYYRLRNHLHKNWNGLFKDTKTLPLFPDYFNPLSAHYHLMLLGSLHTADWSSPFGLLRFTDTVFEFLHAKQKHFDEILFEKRLASYFSPIDPLPPKSTLNGDILYVLRELACQSNERKILTLHLNYLILVHPYAGEELIENARLFLDMINKLQTAKLPESIHSRLTKQQKNCERYLKIVATLYHSEIHSISSPPGMYEWQLHAYQLSTVALCESIQYCIEKLQYYYYIRCTLLASFIPQYREVASTLNRNHSHLVQFATLAEACANLITQVENLEEIPCAESILSDLNIDYPQIGKSVLISLLNGDEPSLTLDKFNPEIINMFRDFPHLYETIEIRFKTKKVQT